jgi:hypothetical protein
MKQWLRSMMLLSVPVLVWGCKSDPTVSSGAGVAAKLVATPSRVFVNQAGSELVTVTSVDEEGRTVPTTFSLTPPADAGITVTLDTTQQLIYDAQGVAIAPTGIATARYIVAASTFTTSSFTVTSAEGKTVTVQVDATPLTVPVTFSKIAIALGDTITITAPAGTFFRTNADTLLQSMVTFASGIKPQFISVSADSNTLRILPGPNDAGLATITNLGVRYNNALRFTATTTTGVTSTPAITNAGTVSPTNSAPGQTITITAPPGTGTRFLPTSKVFFSDNNDLAKKVVVSVDSQSISFIAPPGRTAVKPSVTNVIYTKLPQVRFRQTLTTTNALTTPDVPASLPVTASSTTPAGGTDATLTAGAGFAFAPSATVTIGGTPQITKSLSADSTVLTFAVTPGSTGAVKVTGGVTFDFPLPALPTAVSITAAAPVITKIAGTDALATAPTLNVSPGVATGFIDAPPFGYTGCATISQLGDKCDLYKIVTTADNQKFSVTLTWNNTSDLGLYVLTSAGAFLSAAGNADAGGTGAGGHPETATLTFATPGTYYLAILRFTYTGSTVDPTWYSLQIVGQ